MDNKFKNFNKAREEVNRFSLDIIKSEKKQTYSFTLLPSERQMLKELAENTSIRVSDSQFLGSLIREVYEDTKKSSI